MIVMLYVYSEQLSRKETALVHLANHDSLTGIFNRGHITSVGHKKFTEIRDLEAKMNHIDIGTFTVMLFDIDDFKRVNDLFGHGAGDEVLIRLTENVESLLEDSYVFGRYGGEEFAILLEDVTNEEARSFAEMVRVSIENLSILYLGHSISFTISIGVCPYSAHFKTYDEMMLEVDKQLYIAKAEGKNRTSISAV